MKYSARIIIFGLFVLFASALPINLLFAQEPTASSSASKNTPVAISPFIIDKGSVLGIGNTGPGSLQLGLRPGEPNWVIDAEVTQVGRNAERARQLIYWVVTNPPIYNARILSQTWAITRNITYLLVAFVIIGLALHLVISRRLKGPTFSGISLGLDKISLISILIRVFSILAFITFSYLIVLGLIQGAEVLSNFFTERLGGQDLFNIVFSANSDESNYDFVGYKNADPLEQDMVFTSLLIVRFTSFTYNFMSVILILRHIILMFLLIVSPFLALLLPFIFVRNTGWIWIGEFLRWLFYGPLFALFIASLARIWKAGIPYQFDFTRAQNGDMVYKTGINILYGGPAQVLSPTNTANYVDTYAEYIIALVMLWTAILLPWLLLRIFRDYCCDILEKNQGVLMQILDRLRSFRPQKSPPPTKPGPTSMFGRKMQIPESRSISTREILSKEKIIEKINNREISQIETRDITRTYDLRVSNLKEVALFDTRHAEKTTIKETLANIQNPLRVANPAERKTYESLRDEFTKRANRGDKLARQVIEAATPRASQIKQTISASTSHEQLKKAIEEEGKPISVSQVRVPTTRTISPKTVSDVSKKTDVSEKNVNEILKSISTEKITDESKREEKIEKVSEKIKVNKEKIQEVLAEAEKEVISDKQVESQRVSSDTIREVSEKTEMSQQDVEKVLKEVLSVSNIEQEKQIGVISEKTGISGERIKRVLDATPSDQMPSTPELQPTPSVSIEEYEEIRTMWMNHYRNSEIPRSESIKTREDWIQEDVKKLKNTLDLLISTSAKDRQQGMQQVEDLLPFLLLGGFTDIETLTYIKAKLEAAKLVMDETSRVEDAKMEAKMEAEDIEIIPAVEPKEAQKAKEQKQALEMPLPEDEKDGLNDESKLPGFSDKIPDLPFKPKSTIIDPKKKE